MALIVAPRNSTSGMLLAALNIDQVPFDEKMFPKIGYDIDLAHPEYKNILQKLADDKAFSTAGRFSKIAYSNGKVYLVATISGRFRDSFDHIFDLMALHPNYISVKEEPAYHTAVFEFEPPTFIEELYTLVREGKISSPTKLLTREFADNENVSLEDAINNIINTYK